MTRKCPFCMTSNTQIMHESETVRAYECLECFAVEMISKGRTNPETGGIKPGWYHGWQHPDGRRRDADGNTFPAPISFDRWVGMATEMA